MLSNDECWDVSTDFDCFHSGCEWTGSSCKPPVEEKKKEGKKKKLSKKDIKIQEAVQEGL